MFYDDYDMFMMTLYDDDDACQYDDVRLCYFLSMVYVPY